MILTFMSLLLLVACGKKENDTEDYSLQYEYVAESDAYKVVSCEGDTYSVSIPSTYKDKPVISVGIGAFKNDVTLNSVSLSNSIITIEDEAFYNCTNLKCVTFGLNLEEIGEKAFYNCENLTSFALSSNATGSTTLETPVSLKTIGAWAFAYSGVKIVQFNGEITNIGENAFKNCSQLQQVTLSDGIRTIGDGAFTGNKISKVYLKNSYILENAENISDFGGIFSYKPLDVYIPIEIKDMAESGELLRNFYIGVSGNYVWLFNYYI